MHTNYYTLLIVIRNKHRLIANLWTPQTLCAVTTEQQSEDSFRHTAAVVEIIVISIIAEAAVVAMTAKEQAVLDVISTRSSRSNSRWLPWYLEIQCGLEV